MQFSHNFGLQSQTYDLCGFFQNKIIWHLRRSYFFPRDLLDLNLALCLILGARPQGEFVDDGTETHFTVGEHECCIKAASGGKKKNGIVHYLLLDGEKIPASTQ